MAQDRWIVAENRTLDVERQKSASQLQLLAFEQKQMERKLSSLQNLDQSAHKRHRSISEANLQTSHQLSESLDITFSKLHASLSHSNQNLLSPPRFDDLQRSFSSTSDRDIPEQILSTSEEDTTKLRRRKTIALPRVAVIPPEEERGDLDQSNELY